MKISKANSYVLLFFLIFTLGVIGFYIYISHTLRASEINQVVFSKNASEEIAYLGE